MSGLLFVADPDNRVFFSLLSFLQDVDRIARRDYSPSDDDVVRARLRTLGVQEHRILFETGPAAGMEWWLYDVGGSRTQVSNTGQKQNKNMKIPKSI